MDAVWILRSPIMAPAETATGFLRIAHRDLRAARAMVDPSVFEEDSWGFYLQQATEKGLKEPVQEQLDRAAWNQLCADLLAHVASLIP